MIFTTLNDAFVSEILRHLKIERRPPGIRYLNQLIQAYTRTVPWESVTRIIKRNINAKTANCPRWPVEFWHDALRYGTGGTCYESSLAFFSLLKSIGYQGYLTVNDMDKSRGCHGAITILLRDRKYLVDITIPVHKAVRISETKITRRHTFFHTFTVRPDGENRYQIERSAHPNRNAFTLVDIPVTEPDFYEIVRKDYEESGHFLKSVVMVKVIGDQVWRFNSAERPYKITAFNRSGRTITVLSPHTLAHTLARKFQLPEEKIVMALSYVDNLPASPTKQPLSKVTLKDDSYSASGGIYAN